MARQKPNPKQKYFVVLPCDLGIRGYNEINQIGITSARTPAKAVSNIIARSNQNMVGLIMDQLREDHGSAEKFAFVSPIIIDEQTGRRVSHNQGREALKEAALASDLYETFCKNSDDHPNNYIPLARELLDISRKQKKERQLRLIQ